MTNNGCLATISTQDTQQESGMPCTIPEMPLATAIWKQHMASTSGNSHCFTSGRHHMTMNCHNCCFLFCQCGIDDDMPLSPLHNNTQAVRVKRGHRTLSVGRACASFSPPQCHQVSLLGRSLHTVCPSIRPRQLAGPNTLRQ